ncbi:MAG: DEAD/DEAH box helicase [Planctomycetales bacterium]|nr:DEAD/DEAH box helicase [Planctomycetales bacterium]
MNVHQQSPSADKIRLFRSLFRGREDVYPRRFESSRTGKAGYSPACAHEWAPGICEKPKVKCAACRHRKFLPVHDEAVRWHLSGVDHAGAPFVMGVYPMLLDETCWFLAMDFDKQDWPSDLTAVCDTCRQLQLPVAVERSRSGKGGHVWLFFEEPVPAALARRVGAHILTETMERRPDIGFDSYDRMFPNQDTLPQGGFGNLIALPLQKAARARGNTLFLDEQLQPWPDPWSFLSQLKRIRAADVERIATVAEKSGKVTGVRLPLPEDDEHRPWLLPPSRQREPGGAIRGPERMTITLGDQIYIPKRELSPKLRNQLLRLAAFQNPEFYKAQAQRFPTYGKPRVICCAEDYPDHLALPRGCLAGTLELLRRCRVETSVDDLRHHGESIEVEFRGELRPEQLEAANDLLASDMGVLAATTAFGKTVVAAWLIAQRARNTLIIVHRRQLLEQWVERLAEFLSLAADEIGRLGSGRRRLKGRIDVALMQSLIRKGVVQDCVADYGHLIVDECHHVPAVSFEQVVRCAKAKYVTGLSATVARKDGHHPIVFMQCGPVRHRVDGKTQANARPFDHRVIVRPTTFCALTPPDPDQRLQFQDLCRQLVANEERTRLICADVVDEVRKGRSPLVLTERKDHLEALQKLLEPRVANVLVFRGGLAIGELRDARQRLGEIPTNEERVVLATGRFIGEGFDDSRLDTLFLTMPVSWRGTIAQYAGRLHRLHHRKREVLIFDYADLQAPMLARMFQRRCQGYESIG